MHLLSLKPDVESSASTFLTCIFVLYALQCIQPTTLVAKLRQPDHGPETRNINILCAQSAQYSPSKRAEQHQERERDQILLKYYCKVPSKKQKRTIGISRK